MRSSLYLVFRAVSIFFYVIRSGILAFTIMSWFRPRNNFYMILGRFVAPFIMPFRRLSMFIMRKTRIPVDFSCWFALIGLSVIDGLWWRLYYLLRSTILL